MGHATGVGGSFSWRGWLLLQSQQVADYGEGVWTTHSMASTTSVFPLVTLLLQYFKVVHAAVVGRFFRRGRRQEHAARFGKSASFFLLAAFIPLLNAKRVFGRWTKDVLIFLLGYPWAGFYSHSPLG